MAERRCGTCGIWDSSGFINEANISKRGVCQWFPSEAWPWMIRIGSMTTFESDGTDCPCWRPREEKGEDDG